MKKLLILLFCFSCLPAISQNKTTLTWWNPVNNKFPVMEGQAWPGQTKEPYERLPANAEKTVAADVWGNSINSAGLLLRFRANSPEIVIRYGVKNKERLELNHMPATGVSGIDLYAKDSDGRLMWCAGKRTFSDTITYRFEALRPNDNYHEFGREYQLYLPLYNEVTWLEVGVEEGSYFEPLPVRMEKPIVVYGTSIAQGACASRPGMAWTALLGRKLDQPLINLGFSGSGRLETPVLDLVGEIDAELYILDCMPNLPTDAWERFGVANAAAMKKRVLDAVHQLKSVHPDIPILLVEHAGYTEDLISPARKEAYTVPNQLQAEAFYDLKREGVSGIYYLTKEELGLGLDDMVDGTHPSDLGMMHYAEAYEKKVRSILKEPVGKASTTHPVTQYREPSNYDWEKRHREILTMNEENPPKTVILGNSIIHFWGGLPRTKLVREGETWEKFFTPRGVRNQAYGWDRIENVLWRIYHGELDGFSAEKVIIMIGTNNLEYNTNQEILEGLGMLVDAIQVRQPNTTIMLMGLLPRRAQEPRVAALNEQIARLAGNHSVKFADVGNIFLNQEQKIQEDLFSDGLHPSAAGYRKLREALLPLIDKK